MPELPDVEGFRRYLARHGEGQGIRAVDVLDRQLVRNRSARAFAQQLERRRFGVPRRHGKWLIAPIGNFEVLLHFGMTGLLHFSAGEEERHRHDRIVFVFARGELRYNNMRRFGGVWLARDADERAAVTGALGPDAAGLKREQLEQLLHDRRVGLKAALMDQRLIAGLGNLLSDEIAWRARLHPRTPVGDLGPEQIGAVHEALRGAVGESMRYGRVPHGKRWITRVRDERDPRCPRCGTRLSKGTVAGRTACWCPRCQPD
jgi:formamidopyrimidine-DNA glycosylase